MVALGLRRVPGLYPRRLGRGQLHRRPRRGFRHPYSLLPAQSRRPPQRSLGESCLPLGWGALAQVGQRELVGGWLVDGDCGGDCEVAVDVQQFAGLQ